MPNFHRIRFILKALQILGLSQVGHYACYQLGLRSGYYHWRISNVNRQPSPINRNLIELPEPDDLISILRDQVSVLLTEADEIVNGQVRLFGNLPIPLQLRVPQPLAHWTAYETGRQTLETRDIKYIWEPARFGWAYTLGRAYHITSDERYSTAFWDYTETFLEANPPYLGPNWISAQEVALRLMALSFVYQIFASSEQSTSARVTQLSIAIAYHANRIPPTLTYARAQNNNHLLVEAAGLYTAGSVLPEHPDSPRWRELGWHWFNNALQNQITPDGTYIQHSTNYHRLMLQTAMWMSRISDEFPAMSNQRLAAATNWLFNLIDPISGLVPNLGPNDGAYILPLTICPFSDYRPVLHAAALSFLGINTFPEGLWNEMVIWLGKKAYKSRNRGGPPSPDPMCITPSRPTTLHNSCNSSWGYLRAVRFTSRPGHADQLHLDLWWHGINIAQDPGTYLYNSPPPWDNALARTDVHNTVCIGERDQMTRAGRFLWLDWAQAEFVLQKGEQEVPIERIVARHDGYRRLGVTHQRSVITKSDGRWIIEDTLLPVIDSRLKNRRTSSIAEPSCQVRLHWLFPDWSWKIEEDKQDPRIEIHLKSALGWIRIAVKIIYQFLNSDSQNFSYNSSLSLVRAGELLSGTGPISPSRGWVSPTYGHKIPALSFALETKSPLPLSFVTEWTFPLELDE